MSIAYPPLIEPSPDESVGTTEGSARSAITIKTLRVWGSRFALSVLDQGLTSGAGFLVNLLLARRLRAEVYGAFAVAFAGYLFISGFHNVLLLEPMSVMGPSRHAVNLAQYFRAQLTIHVILTGLLGAVSLMAGTLVWWFAPDSPLVGAVIGSGIALPFLLLLWLVRRMCYVVQRPSAALGASAFYVLFVAAGLLMLMRFGWLGSFAVFLLMGAGSIFASGILLWWLRVLGCPALQTQVISWRSALRENWIYGRWMMGSAVLFPVLTQVQIILVAGVLGLGAAGILRAMQIPSLVTTQVITVISFSVLPAFSRNFGRGMNGALWHRAGLVSLAVTSGTLLFAAVLLLFSGRTERLLFGGKYGNEAWLMPVLALIPVCSGLGMGYSMALRASQMPQFDLLANVIATPVGIISAILFLRWWGLAGAAASMVAANAALSSVFIFCSHRFLRERR